MMKIPRHNNRHDNKFDNVKIIDKKLSAPRGMAEKQASDDRKTN